MCKKVGERSIRAKNFVDSYFDAWNDRDPKAVAGHLSADGTYCDVPENTERTQDQLVASLDSFFSNFRHCCRLIGRLVTGDNTIAFQYEALTVGFNSNPAFYSAFKKQVGMTPANTVKGN